LVKIYIQEPESALVFEAVGQAKTVAVSTLALPEAISVFTRHAEKNILTQIEAQQAFADLLLDWENLDRYSLENHIAKEAGSLAQSRSLRGADAVQLATAAVVAREQRGVRLLAFDDKLNAAAKGIVRLYSQ
jgi:predicted nucleic acid-binding protein